MVAGKEASPQDVQATDRLRAYWERGPGAAKIQWGVPGDWSRCVAELGKYISRPEGYCTLMHKRVTGFYPGHAPGEEAAHATKDAAKGGKG